MDNFTGLAGQLRAEQLDNFTGLRTNGKTRLELTYNVGGYSPNGLNQLAPLVDSVLLEQLTRLKHFIELGTADAK